jgi:hypothetical protein
VCTILAKMARAGAIGSRLPYVAKE